MYDTRFKKNKQEKLVSTLLACAHYARPFILDYAPLFIL